MSPGWYNACTGVGVTMLSVGAGAQFGWPAGLMAAGALLVVLSMFALRLALRLALR